MWPAMLGAVTGIAGGLGSFFGNRETNKTNAQLTRETNAQNEQLMREQWQREDNAVQRRAQDLQSAGLSKTLAAGSPASAGSLSQMERPEYNNSTQGALDTAYKMMSMVQDFEKRANENRLISAQARNVDTKTAGESISNMIKNYNYVEMLPVDKKIKLSILDKNLIDNENLRYNLERFGSTKGPSSVVKPFHDVLSFLLGNTREKRINALEQIGRGHGNAYGSLFKYFKNFI